MASPRDIPSLDRLRKRAGIQALERRFGADATRAALREAADAVRGTLREHPEDVAAPDLGERIECDLTARLGARYSGSLRRVINATGVVIHTNLGRAPLAP